MRSVCLFCWLKKNQDFCGYVRVHSEAKSWREELQYTWWSIDTASGSQDMSNVFVKDENTMDVRKKSNVKVHYLIQYLINYESKLFIRSYFSSYSVFFHII